MGKAEEVGDVEECFEFFSFEIQTSLPQTSSECQEVGQRKIFGVFSIQGLYIPQP